MKYKKLLIFLYLYLLMIYFLTNNTSASTFTLNLAPQKNALRVVSYNIHFGMNPLIKPNISKISKFLSTIDADIICLQEVDKFSIRSLFENQPKLLSESLSMNMVYKKTGNILLGETGNLILSKFPIISVEHIELPSLKYPRSTLKITIDTPYGIIKVINTHLGLSKVIREKQINILNKIISNDNLPTIVTGDFNTSDPSEFDHLFSQLKDSATITQKDHIQTFVNSKYNSRIDYILMPKDFYITFYDVPKIMLSDHYPVIVDVKHYNHLITQNKYKKNR